MISGNGKVLVARSSYFPESQGEHGDCFQTLEDSRVQG